ncbi:MAG: hypothetical protein H6736_19955 [Alphaproteobacteria bacterium]|nr:hypothetical protein [Alphaproteobacteria bacterium]MCB9694089.1 hypothetical protein [Alphaproteobacteria bacterium]
MTGPLATSDNLFDFFHDRVQMAHREVAADFHGDTVLYLARLLAERARTDIPRTDADTLAELHGAAAHAPPGRQASAYRELGDRALYLLGFFREHLDRARRPVGPAYYADMGAAAYLRCDQVLKRWFADAFGPVFVELSRHFSTSVELLAAVRRQAGPDDLAMAYERWLLTADAVPSDDAPRGIIVLGEG